MSGRKTIKAAAKTPPAISDSYLSDMRLYIRQKSTLLDTELKDLINAARGDLVLGGVLPERVQDESDPLIKRAISTYIKAEFGLDNDEAELLRESFRRQKIALALASDYIGYGGEA